MTNYRRSGLCQSCRKEYGKTKSLLACLTGFPGGSDGKGSACNAGDLGLIPGSERYTGEGNGNPHQHSCLGNSTDREAWWAVVHGVTKSQA